MIQLEKKLYFCVACIDCNDCDVGVFRLFSVVFYCNAICSIISDEVAIFEANSEAILVK
jgi:hypothetical protein